MFSRTYLSILADLVELLSWWSFLWSSDRPFFFSGLWGPFQGLQLQLVLPSRSYSKDFFALWQVPGNCLSIIVHKELLSLVTRNDITARKKKEKKKWLRHLITNQPTNLSSNKISFFLSFLFPPPFSDKNPTLLSQRKNASVMNRSIKSTIGRW